MKQDSYFARDGYAGALGAFALNQAIVYGLTVRLWWPFWASLMVVVAVIPPFTFLLAKLWALAPDAREP